MAADEVDDSSADDEVSLKFPTSVNHEEISHDLVKKTVEFSIDLKDWPDAFRWIDEFCLVNYFSFVVESTKKPTKFTLYKKYFRCAHNPRNKGKALNSDCSAHMIVTGRVANKKLKTPYPCVVELVYKHNHHLRSKEALQNRPVCLQTHARLTALLWHHGPKEAFDKLKDELKHEYGTRWAEICHDTAYCPNLQYVYQLHRKLKSEETNKTRIRRWIHHEHKKPAASVEEREENFDQNTDECSDYTLHKDTGSEGDFDQAAQRVLDRTELKIDNYCSRLAQKLSTLPHVASDIEKMLELLPNPSLADAQFEYQLKTLLRQLHSLPR